MFLKNICVVSVLDRSRHACQKKLGGAFVGVVAQTNRSCCHDGLRRDDGTAKQGCMKHEGSLPYCDGLAFGLGLAVLKHDMLGGVVKVGLCQDDIGLERDATGTSYLGVAAHKNAVAHQQDATFPDANEAVDSDAHYALDTPFPVEHKLGLASRNVMILVRLTNDEGASNGILGQDELATKRESEPAIDLYRHTKDCLPSACQVIEAAGCYPVETKYVTQFQNLTFLPLIMLMPFCGLLRR